MTLALYGKSRQRQQGLLLAGLMAIIVAALAGAAWMNTNRAGAASATFAVASASCSDDGDTDDDPSPPGDCANNTGDLNVLDGDNNGRVNVETDDAGQNTGDDDLTVTFDLTSIPNGSTITAATLKVWSTASDAAGSLKAGSNGGGSDSVYGSAAPGGAPASYSNAALLTNLTAALPGNSFSVNLSMNCTPDSDDCGALIDQVALDITWTPPADTDADGVPDSSDSCPTGTVVLSGGGLYEGCSIQQLIAKLHQGTANTVDGPFCTAADFNFVVDMSGSIGEQGDHPSNLPDVKNGITGFVNAYNSPAPGTGDGLYSGTEFSADLSGGADPMTAGFVSDATFNAAVAALSGPSGNTPTAAGITAAVANNANDRALVDNFMFVVTDGSPNVPDSGLGMSDPDRWLNAANAAIDAANAARASYLVRAVYVSAPGDPGDTNLPFTDADDALWAAAVMNEIDGTGTALSSNFSALASTLLGAAGCEQTGTLVIMKVRDPNGAAADGTTFSGTITNGNPNTWSGVGFGSWTSSAQPSGVNLTVDEDSPTAGWTEVGWIWGSMGTTQPAPICSTDPASYVGAAIVVNLLPNQTQVVCVMNTKAGAPPPTMVKVVGDADGDINNGIQPYDANYVYFKILIDNKGTGAVAQSNIIVTDTTFANAQFWAQQGNGSCVPDSTPPSTGPWTCSVDAGKDLTLHIRVPIASTGNVCVPRDVVNTASATQDGKPLGVYGQGSQTATVLNVPAQSCPRTIRVQKVTGAADGHGGGTFSGSITSSPANVAWSQTLGTNDQISAGTDYQVAPGAQTLTENEPTGSWFRAGFYVTSLTAACPPASSSLYQGTQANIPAEGNYLVCVRNSRVTVEKYDGDGATVGDGTYDATGEFHWVIKVVVEGSPTSDTIEVIDTPADANVKFYQSPEAGSPFGSCSGGGTPFAISCPIPSGTQPGTYYLPIHIYLYMGTGPLAERCGPTSNNVKLKLGDRVLAEANDTVEIENCTRTIQLCKVWRPNAILNNPVNFTFEASDSSEENPDIQLVTIFGVAEDGKADCILLEVSPGLVRLNEIVPAGFILEGVTISLGDSPDNDMTPDLIFGNNPPWDVNIGVPSELCHPEVRDPALVGVFSLLRSIAALVTEVTQGEPECTITFFNRDDGVTLNSGDIRVEKWNDINGDGDEDPGIGEGLIPNWDMTIAGPDANETQPTSSVNDITFGTYTWAGLISGDVYTITEDMPAGWAVTNTKVDGVDGPASAVVAVAVPNGGDRVVRFYNWQRGSIKVHKEAILRHNGVNSPAPNDDDGWKFTVDSAKCNVHLEGVTDANGNLTFNGLPMCNDYIVAESGTNAASPGFVLVSPGSPFTNQSPEGQTLTFLNRKVTNDPPCQDCRQPSVTPTTPPTTPPTNPPTTVVPPTNTPVPRTDTPVSTVQGEKTPGPGQTPIAPSTGSGLFGSGGSGLNLLLLLGGLLAISSGLGFLALGRRK